MTRYQIGELAKMTGLTVRTIRFYSDSGLIPPVDRTTGGYRTYDADAVARLKLVRTLRDLGVDLPTAGRVLAREVSVTDVARAHADAIDAQMKTLRLRRAVLRAVAKGGEMELMNELARMSDEERQRILDDFFEEVFGPYELDPQFEQHMRSVRIELPDDPSTEQLEAWVELAKLVQDPDFRASVKRMSQQHEEYRRNGEDMGPRSENQMEAFTFAIAQAREAIDAGIAPGSAAADEVVDRVNANWAQALGLPNDEHLVTKLREFADFADPRAERYWVLIAKVNGWPAVPDHSRERAWLREAGQPFG
ncbi:MerR family transcriptional regulator [Lentzea jiangxiensis]|uniref:DNA-binding transcriptional regulator, MerR family n=1 Tax=Lentzea jiangxiensis TaxID=641025 RepID=A0A1H0WLR9_9PSEU|nr:MerR family transcriptional regulator [Lentzea jiangxiensis]SDP91642.1 DNA-binding transcriptional regulator, MerR family [Lentzea jiangxiensis]